MRINSGKFAYDMRYEKILSDSVRFDQVLDNRITILENIILSQTKEIEFLRQKLDEMTTK